MQESNFHYMKTSPKLKHIIFGKLPCINSFQNEFKIKTRTTTSYNALAFKMKMINHLCFTSNYYVPSRTWRIKYKYLIV